MSHITEHQFLLLFPLSYHRQFRRLLRPLLLKLILHLMKMTKLLRTAEQGVALPQPRLNLWSSL